MQNERMQSTLPWRLQAHYWPLHWRVQAADGRVEPGAGVGIEAVL